MSNLTVVVTSRRGRPTVERWLQDRGGDRGVTETHVVDLGRGWRMYLVSRDVRRDVRGNSYFRGTAIFPKQHAVTFNVDGWLAVQQGMPEGTSTEGTYFAVDWGKRKVSIYRDIFTNVPLLYTSGPEFMAASDSLLILTDLRARFGFSVRANSEVLAARAFANTFVNQQISPETQVRKIWFVPAGRCLNFHIGRNPEVRLTGDHIAARVFANSLPYAESIRNLAGSIAGLVQSLGQSESIQTTLLLSGGLDSRIVLAAAGRSDVLSRLRIVTTTGTPEQRADFRIAYDLAQQFGFVLNSEDTRSPRWEASGNTPLGTWATALLGTYDRLLPPAAWRHAVGTLSLTGIGSEILKGNWGWCDINTITKDMVLAPDIKEALAKQLLKSLASIGAEPDWQDASELYYLGYRNGLHGGMSSAVVMSDVMPLQLFDMAVLGHSRRDGRRRTFEMHEDLAGSRDASLDLLCVLDPEMAAAPFEPKAATVDVDHRVSELGGKLRSSEIPEFTLYGQPSDVTASGSALAVSISAAKGLDGPMGSEALLDRAESLCDAAPRNVRKHYRRLLRHARSRMLDHGLSPTWSGGALPKVLTLSLFE